MDLQDNEILPSIKFSAHDKNETVPLSTKAPKYVQKLH